MLLVVFVQISREELITVLAQFNPWWRGKPIADLPTWRRAAFHHLFQWLTVPPASRAILLSGERQVGKTTRLLQAIDALVRQGGPPGNILYATFDHPLVKLAGIEAVLQAWRDREPHHRMTCYDRSALAKRRLYEFGRDHKVNIKYTLNIIFIIFRVHLICA